MEIRAARPEEFAAIGELTMAAYLTIGLDPSSPYADELRDAATRAEEGQLVVAVDGDQLAGSVTFAPHGSELAELAAAGEAEFRMLVVDPARHRRGTGTRLVQEVLRRAGDASAVRLSTGPAMVAAHRLYERLGFARTPDLDWEPAPGLVLLTYALPATCCAQCGRPLAADHAACQATLDPPRWCPWCRRRMTVQVTPTGWTAHCTQHGPRRG